MPKGKKALEQDGKSRWEARAQLHGGAEGGSEGSVPPLHSVPIWLDAALTSQEDVPRGRDWRGQLAH